MNTETEYLKSIAEAIAFKSTTLNPDKPDHYLLNEAKRLEKAIITELAFPAQRHPAGPSPACGPRRPLPALRFGIPMAAVRDDGSTQRSGVVPDCGPHEIKPCGSPPLGRTGG